MMIMMKMMMKIWWCTDHSLQSDTVLALCPKCFISVLKHCWPVRSNCIKNRHTECLKHWGIITSTHTQTHIDTQVFLSSTSKSRTNSLVSSVPFLLPTAHTSLVLLHLTLHTTPPLPPLSRETRFLRKSPDFKSHILTVPSSDDVITNFLLNCRHVTALWCLFGPER